MDKPKFCKKCVHFAKNTDLKICTRNVVETKTLNLVTGEYDVSATGYLNCDSERKDKPGKCGPEGKFFQKKSWWK